MRKLIPILLFLPGCTFYSFGNNGPAPRTAAELKDASPAVYLILAVFVLILLLSVFTALFKESKSGTQRDDTKAMALMMAFGAAVIVLLLVA